MSNTTQDPWHFARPELARQYLQTFQVGLISAQALFAPRRMGKSEFLEKDLVPAAKKSGLLTAYLNLWDARENPRAALISVLALSELMRNFDHSRRKLLLILDEAQVLALPTHSDLAHSLRAALDIRKQTIKVVFAGSSESSLRRMFGRATEPFYNWAPIEPFARLGAEFVAAMTRKVNQLSRYPLSEREALRAFESLKRTPEFFRRYLQRYLAYAELGSRAALDDTLAHVFNDASYSFLWGKLLPADQAILRAIAEGVSDLHSLPARKQLGKELGLGKPASLDTPKNALRRLQKEELVMKLEYGQYQIHRSLTDEGGGPGGRRPNTFRPL